MNEAAPAPMTARPPGGEWPLVSVVVPAYNAEAYIVDCLRSILQQDYPALQVIVVDDGSTDATPERVQTLGAAVTYRRQPNSGSAVARNLGVALAEGEYVAFCDSDDLWAPHRLKQQVDFLRGQGKYHAVCGRFMAVPDTFGPDDAARQAYQAEPVLDPTKSGWTYLRLLETSIYHLDALLVRCEVVKAIRFNPDYRRGQDFDFFLQLVQATPIAQLDNLYAFYRQNPHSITRRPHVRNYRAEIIAAALQRWGPYRPDGTRDACRRARPPAGHQLVWPRLRAVPRPLVPQGHSVVPAGTEARPSPPGSLPLRTDELAAPGSGRDAASPARTLMARAFAARWTSQA
jgi:glycosyltransferase involved in cell wall biosynthesis